MKRNRNLKNDNAQMILIAGVIISVSIITLSSISSNISNVGVELSFETSITPLEEYINVREVFVDVFKSSCGGHNDTEIIQNAFNHVKNILFNVEMRYGNFFTAEIRDIRYASPNITHMPINSNEFLQITVFLKLTIKQTKIEEEIKIPIEITT